MTPQWLEDLQIDRNFRKTYRRELDAVEGAADALAERGDAGKAARLRAYAAEIREGLFWHVNGN
jgi:hypothetical protein